MVKSSKLLLLILLFILTGYTSCIKEFIPRSDKYDELLVVEGAITDKPGPYIVKLSKSGNLLQQSTYKPYTKCGVEIADDFGNKEILTEVSDGVYKTDSSGIQGIAGRKYKIKIATPDGELYESEEELLRQGAGIDTVYANREQKNGREGYQFYLDAENSAENTNYYFWALESTYKFRTDFSITWYYDGVSVKLFPVSDSLRTGYRTQQILDIYTLDGAKQSLTQQVHIPLNYEDNYTKALTIRYSLKVNQYTISERAYTFWNTLKKMNANQGSLYTQQPYQVRGNIVNINDPEKRALGYFMAAGMDEKRIFVDPLFAAFHYPVCFPDTNSPCSDCLGEWIYHTSPEQWPIYFSKGPFSDDEHILDPRCVDCRIEGYLKKPDYWVD